MGKFWVKRLLVALLFILFFSQAYSLLFFHSLSFDEHAHVASGYVYLKTGRFPGGWNNPPFGQTLLGLPYGLGFFDYHPETGVPPYAGRAVNVLLAIFLGLGIYSFSKTLFGPWGGLLSLALFTFSPLIVAYSTIATTDLPVSVFPLFFLYCLYLVYRDQKTLWLIPAGAFLAFSAGCKNNALIIVAFAPFILLGPSVKEKEKTTTYLRNLFILFFSAWFFFCATHCFHGCFENKPKVNFKPLQLLAPILPTKAVESVASHLDIAAHGRETYFLGQHKMDGFLSYYPLMFLMKSPLGTLLLFFLFLCFLIVSRQRDFLAELHFLWFPGAAYFFITAAINAEQVGLRHAMIFHPILYVAMGLLGKESLGRKWLRYIIIFAILCNALTVFSIHPRQMSYLNYFAWNMSQALPVGGPDLDWGQEDEIVVEYLEALHDDIKVQIIPFPRFIPRLGHIAVNVEVYAHGLDREDRFRYDWLRVFAPKGMIGNSWFHFEVTEQDIDNLAIQPLQNKMPHYVYLSYHFWKQNFSKVEAHAKKMPPDSVLALLFMARTRLLQRNFKAAVALYDQLKTMPIESIYSWDNWALWAEIAKHCLDNETSGGKVDIQELAKLGVYLFTANQKMLQPFIDELLLRPDLAQALEKEKPEGLLLLLKAHLCVSQRKYKSVLRLLREPISIPQYQAAADKLKELATTQLMAENALTSTEPIVYRINHIWKSLLFQKEPDDVWQKMLALYHKYPLNYELIRHLNMMHMLRRGFGCYNVRYDTGANLLYDRIDPKSFIYQRRNRATIAHNKDDGMGYGR